MALLMGREGFFQNVLYSIEALVYSAIFDRLSTQSGLCPQPTGGSGFGFQVSASGPQYTQAPIGIE